MWGTPFRESAVVTSLFIRELYDLQLVYDPLTSRIFDQSYDKRLPHSRHTT
jgi:hypothetical protein